MRRRVLLVGAAVFVAAFVVIATPLVTFERPAPWELATPPNPTDTSIDITVLGGGCRADDERLGDVAVEETADTVVVTATIRKPVVTGTVCPAVLRVHQTSVKLRAPVGDRRLVDGRTGQTSPPRAP